MSRDYGKICGAHIRFSAILGHLRQRASAVRRAFGDCGALRYVRVSVTERSSAMSKEMTAVLVFGAIAAIALVMLVIERRGIAARKAARGGREVDVGSLIAFGSAAGEGQRTKVPGDD
jgi:hypothetical protein